MCQGLRNSREIVILGTYRLTHLASELLGLTRLHKFANNEQEISIPHEASECGVENFEFIVSQRVQVNPDN